MKKILKNIFFAFSFFTAKLLSFFGYFFNRPVILLYHSVGENNSKYTVSEKDFVKQMEFLKRNKKVISLEELVNLVASSQKTNNLVAITIDDGYLDTVDFVATKIKEFGFPPATVFLTTNLDQSEKLGGIKRPSGEQITRSYSEKSLVFEIHGQNHKPFREALLEGEDVLRSEILDCKNKIFQLTGCNSTFLAYPSGRESQEVRNFVNNLGIRVGFGNHYGTVSSRENIMSLPRVQVDRDTSFFLFKTRLTRAVDMAEKIKRFFKKYAKRR